MTDIKKDVIEKIRKAESIEEVKTILKENKIRLDDEEIKELYDKARHSLSDDDVAKVAGGIRDRISIMY